MDPAFILIQSLNGLATASTLFIAACGLSIIFGVTRIVNFAHGSFYMLGAYVAVTLVPQALDIWYGQVSFWVAILASALAVGVIGVAMEVLLLRRIYKAPELFQLLATFGVVLLVQDLVIAVWGPDDILGPREPELRGSVEILGRRFPEYELVMIVAGPAVLLAVWALLRRTRFGILIRAATQDREMVGALGVNQKLLFTGVLFLGAFLAGLGGALQIPRAPATPLMDVDMIAEAFVVTVIGGMGSVPGAFLAAVLIGQLQAFGIVIFPKITLVLVFLVMAVVLIVRPWGLLGRPEALPNTVYEGDRPLKPFSSGAIAALLAVLAALIALPFFADSFTLKLGIEVFILAVFAASLGLLMTVGGMISFGHAAYFGLGAYGAALAATHLAVPMELGLALAPFVGAFGAALFGYFIVRLSGVYLAMLTLAVAQILYAVAFQWIEFTGGDNGIIGVWPSSWASERVPFYYLTLTLCSLALFLLYRVVHAPFGYTLRAGRDSMVRADAIGIDVRHHRWLAFTLAGAAAGL
ncbi:MAG: ABC transporter permease, partial [Pseudomonadota bacterium]